MKTYKFEKTVYYGDNYNFDITLPDNFVFCEYMRYSENQRFYFSIVKDPSEEMTALFKNAYQHTRVLGNLLIGMLNNVKPLCNIPEITIDEINNLYMEDLRRMYVVNECKNQKYESLLINLRQLCIFSNDDVNITLNTEEVTNLMNELNKIKPFYLESIVRPIKFVKGGDYGPFILCDTVQFNSWLDVDKKIDCFQKTDIDVTKLTDSIYIGINSKSTVYMDEAAKEWKNKFENRIREITKSAFE